MRSPWFFGLLFLRVRRGRLRCFCAVGLNEPIGNRFLFVFFLFSANTSSYFGVMNCGASGAATTLAGAVTAISSSGETVCVTALNPSPVMSLGTPSVPAAETAVTVAPQPFDVRLIPEYDGTADIVEWLQRTEFLCQLRGVSVDVRSLAAADQRRICSLVTAPGRCSELAGGGT